MPLSHGWRTLHGAQTYPDRIAGIDDFARSHQCTRRGRPNHDLQCKSKICEERENDIFRFPLSKKPRMDFLQSCQEPMTNRSRKKSQPSPFLYRSLASYLREIFGAPIRKVPVDPGFGCPNRDGTVGRAGCSFCVPESFVPSHARGDRKSTRLNSSHIPLSRMPSSA